MSAIRPEFVEFIPAMLTPGVLCISERYRTASHLCPCGCGERVVTPLSPADWTLIRKAGLVSLDPSIGNWNYACRSHYWIRDNQIIWSRALSAEQIARVQQWDRQDKARWVQQRNQAKAAGRVPQASTSQHVSEPIRRSSWWSEVGNAIARFLQRLS